MTSSRRSTPVADDTTWSEQVQFERTCFVPGSIEYHQGKQHTVVKKHTACGMLLTIFWKNDKLDSWYLKVPGKVVRRSSTTVLPMMGTCISDLVTCDACKQTALYKFYVVKELEMD